VMLGDLARNEDCWIGRMEEVLCEVRGPIWIITINRPEQRNAINMAVVDGLHSAFNAFEADPSARVAILTGAGERAFCAGADLVDMPWKGAGSPPPGFFPVIGQGLRVTKPSIAAVNGFAYAGGWMFAQMCDLCVAADSAKFAITEAKVGRSMAWAPPLVNMLPQRVLLELLLTGAPLGAQRLYELGYINRVVPSAELLPTAMSLAEQIAVNAPLTVDAAKRMVSMSCEMGLSAALATAVHIFEPVLRSEDAQEGPRSFREKRPPAWKGR
jgi:enoyl-CoA hydratase